MPHEQQLSLALGQSCQHSAHGGPLIGSFSRLDRIRLAASGAEGLPDNDVLAACAPLLAPQHVIGQVGRHPVEPGAHVVFAWLRLQSLPQLRRPMEPQEGLLCQVFRFLSRAGDAVEQPEDRLIVGQEERVERGLVPRLGGRARPGVGGHVRMLIS